jgi:hypothetical protein
VQADHAVEGEDVSGRATSGGRRGRAGRGAAALRLSGVAVAGLSRGWFLRAAAVVIR